MLKQYFLIIFIFFAFFILLGLGNKALAEEDTLSTFAVEKALYEEYITKKLTYVLQKFLGTSNVIVKIEANMGIIRLKGDDTESTSETNTTSPDALPGFPELDDFFRDEPRTLEEIKNLQFYSHPVLAIKNYYVSIAIDKKISDEKVNEIRQMVVSLLNIKEERGDILNI